MLISGVQADQVRAVVVDDDVLDAHHVQVEEALGRRGNIYRGIVANVQPSLDAAFVDFGADRHGFLAMQDLVPAAYHYKPNGAGEGKPRIEQLLEPGRPVLVQVTKDAVDNKGAALSTNVSLAGRYLVLLPYDEEAHGVSRKVENEQERQRIKEFVRDLAIPNGFGYIVRTNAMEQTKAELDQDLESLMVVWQQIWDSAQQGRGPKLLYNDQDLVTQSLRDYLDLHVEEIIVDTTALFDKVQQYVATYMPRSQVKLSLYRGPAPLFVKFGIEGQIHGIYQRQVPLRSGGSLVVDHTEALTVIDVNSGKSTGAATQEETAAHTNLEAAEEIARQLRLRDIGGLIVVDFIDMRSHRDQSAVAKKLRDSMKRDRARCNVAPFSENGLVEINRQRIKQQLRLRSQQACPTCRGVGRIGAVELLGPSLLGRIEERALRTPATRLKLTLHPEVVNYLQNRCRRQLVAIEDKHQLNLQVVADANLSYSDELWDWSDRPSQLAASAIAPAAASTATDGPTAAGRRPRRPTTERGRRPPRAPRGEKPGEKTVIAAPSPLPQTSPPSSERRVATPRGFHTPEQRLELERRREQRKARNGAPSRRRRGGRRGPRTASAETTATESSASASSPSIE